MISTWIRERAGEVRRHPLVGAAVLLTSVAGIAIRATVGDGGKAAAYVAALLVAAFVTDIVARRDTEVPALPVRRPARETAALIALLGVGAAWFLFVKLDPARWNALTGVPRLLLLLVGMGCLFQVAAGLYLFAIERYRPAELGLLPRGLLDAPAVLVIVAVTAVLVDPGGVTLPGAVEEFGWLGLFAFAFFGEPLSEEFMRLTLQTRLGALMRNPAAAWFLASIVWAFLHVPGSYARSGNLLSACAGAVCIVPIGLLWGYLTHRTRSIWPALLCHGFNLWGLQNS